MKRFVLNDNFWVFMSFGAIVTLALLLLWNMTLSAKYRQQREDNQVLGTQVIKDGETLQKQMDLIEDQKKLIDVQAKLILALKKAEEIRKQPCP